VANQKITNLSNILQLLQKESISEGDRLANQTAPLKVVTSDKEGIVVASSVDQDVQIRFRGVKNISVGSFVVVDIQTGDLTVVSAPESSPKPGKKQAAERGCNDKSFISR
jgi:hypothetical protein